MRLRSTDLVIDVDPRNGGNESWEKLQDMVELPDAPMVLTGGDGLHVYFRKPADVLIRTKLPDLPGVEFKTEGAQVVAPGSIHPDTGKEYSWDLLAMVAPGEAPDAPPELLGMLRRDDADRAPAEVGGVEPHELEAMLDVLDVEDFRDHGEWLDLMMACHDATDGQGLKALFGAEWFSDAEMDFRSKDAAINLAGVWLHEFAELDSMRRADVGTLKAFMSRAVDRLRKPFERVTSDLPRRCVFAGTVNESGYLMDSTGNRRFWPVDVLGEVDVGAIGRDRDRLWAEAAFLEESGADHVLPREFWGVAAERQADETSEDPWADQLRCLVINWSGLEHDDRFTGAWGGGIAEGRVHTAGSRRCCRRPAGW